MLLLFICEFVVFYIFYEMGGRFINWVIGVIFICYEGICGIEIFFGGMMVLVFYYFFNKEYGSSVMDYINYLNFYWNLIELYILILSNIVK